MYIGVGPGFDYTRFAPNYSGAHPHTRPQFVGKWLAGYKLNKNWRIEFSKMYGDLDIESGHADIGIMEDHSRINNWLISIVYKF